MLDALLLVAALGAPSADTAAYQAVMLRAAPGHLMELIDALQARMPLYAAAGEHRPLLLRHAQGDQWDLLLLVPIGSLAGYFSDARAARWREAAVRAGQDEGSFVRRLDQWVSWREELYVSGPPVAALDSATAGAGYFHLEIFQGLAGKRDSLLRERVMENDFLRRIGRPANLVFTKLTGAAWDYFTLGFYRDLPHYAEPARVTPEQEEAAARAAGFESRSAIGAYLRRFLGGHHDTLGTIVR